MHYTCVFIVVTADYILQELIAAVMQLPANLTHRASALSAPRLFLLPSCIRAR